MYRPCMKGCEKKMKKLKIFEIDDLPYGTKVKIVYTIDGIANMQMATIFDTKLGLQNGKIIEKKELKSWMDEGSCTVYEVDADA